MKVCRGIGLAATPLRGYTAGPSYPINHPVDLPLQASCLSSYNTAPPIVRSAGLLSFP